MSRPNPDPQPRDDPPRLPLSDATHRELRELARGRLAKAGPAPDLDVTDLVHEAYLRLAKRYQDGDLTRSHLKAVACQAMCQILIDHARRRGARKRGEGRSPISISAAGLHHSPRSVSLLDLEDALARMAELDPRQAYILRLRYFGGLKIDDICEVVNLSRTTVEDELHHGRAWLAKQLATASERS